LRSGDHRSVAYGLICAYTGSSLLVFSGSAPSSPLRTRLAAKYTITTKFSFAFAALRAARLGVAPAVVFFLFFRHPRQRYQPFTFFEFDLANALGVAPDDADIFDPQANDLTDVGDQHELVLLCYLLHADDATGAVAGLHRDNAFAAA
jgi:hypothetical protein